MVNEIAQYFRLVSSALIVLCLIAEVRDFARYRKVVVFEMLYFGSQLASLILIVVFGNKPIVMTVLFTIAIVALAFSHLWYISKK